MTVMEEVLVEEYMRALRIERLVKSEIEELPKGSIQKKKIKVKEYPYLQYRCGNAIKSQYIKAQELHELEILIAKRKEHISTLKQLQKTKAQIEKALGKDLLHEHKQIDAFMSVNNLTFSIVYRNRFKCGAGIKPCVHV